MQPIGSRPTAPGRRVLHVGAFTDVYVESLAAHLQRRTGIRSSALGMTRLNANGHSTAFESDRPLPDIARGPAMRLAVAFAGELYATKLPRGRWDATTGVASHLLKRRNVHDAGEHAYQFLRTSSRARLVAPLLAGFDAYHLHSLFPATLFFVDVLPPESSLLLSIWGSDLLRCDGSPEVYAAQLRACERATLISVPSLELRQVLIAKFGTQLTAKTRITIFGSSNLDALRRIDPCRTLAFRRQHGILPDRRIVCVGHNGDPWNAHLAILEQVSRLPADLRSMITVVLPMTYKTDDPAYVQRVRRAATEGCLDFRLLTDFMTPDAVAELRAATDVYIHLPVTDAMSSTMSEVLYAGNLVITGAWLPYGLLRSRGIRFAEISAFEELAPALADTLRAFDREKELVRGNRARVEQLRDWTHAIDSWVAVYNELLAAGVEVTQ